MKIGELDMRCGECDLIDCCRSVAFDYAFCADERLEAIEVKDFLEIAEKVTFENYKKPKECEKCNKECNEHECEHGDVALESETRHIAKCVLEILEVME